MRDLMLVPNTWSVDRAQFDLRLSDTSSEALAQKLRLRLSMVQGEYFLDTTIGIPYTTRVLVKAPDKVIIDAYFKREILRTAGVAEIKSYSSVYNASARSLQISFTVIDSSGDEVYVEV